MKRFQLSILLLCQLLLLATSCGNDEPFKHVIEAAEPKAFNQVISDIRGQSGIYDDAAYYITFDDDRRTASITIANLRVDETMTPLTLTFDKVPMTFTPNRNERQMIIQQPLLVSNDPTGANTEITDVTIVYSRGNILDSYGAEGIYARFTIAGRYTITAYPYRVFAEGTTRLIDLADDSEKFVYQPVYTIILDPHRSLATLTVHKLPNLPENEEIVVEDLSLTLQDNGYVLSMTSSTQVHAPHSVSVSACSANAEFLKDLSLEMNITIGNISYRLSGFLTTDFSY